MEKTPWYYTVQFQRNLFLFCIIVFVIASWGPSLRRFILRRKIESVTKSANAMRLQQASGWTSNIYLLHLAGIGIVFFGFLPSDEIMQGFAYGMPSAMHAVQLIPFAGMLATLALIFYYIKSWSESDFTLSKKIFYSVVSLTAIGYAWFLNYWNALGYRF